jgi:acyl carrier protein
MLFAQDPGMTETNPADDFLYQKVLDIIVEHAHAHVPRETIVPDSRLFDLTDSLGVMEIVMALEDEFEGSIPDEVASTIQTVRQLVEHVRTRLASRPAPHA